jgi:TorA maturation chaperone TorD
LKLPIRAKKRRARIYTACLLPDVCAAIKDLLQVLSSAETNGEGVLGEAWTHFIETARKSDAELVRDEYEQLFVGTGKPEVLLYGSYYLSGFLMEKPLAALRTDLQNLGLERAEHIVESEDHIASLCEVMRYLIASDDILQANLATQKQFFATHAKLGGNDVR